MQAMQAVQIENPIPDHSIEVQELPTSKVGDSATDSSRENSSATGCAVIRQQPSSAIAVNSSLASCCCCSSSSSSSSPSPSNQLPHGTTNNNNLMMNALAFRRIGIGFLIVQAAATVGFSWYAWHIRNGRVEYPAAGVLYFWIFFGVWKSAMPYKENSFLFGISGCMLLVGLNPILIYVIDIDSDSKVAYTAFFVVNKVLTIVVGMVLLEWYSRGMRKITKNQHHLNEIAMASLETTIRAGLFIIYAVAAAVSGLNGKSLQELKQSIAFIKELEEGESFISASYLEERIDAAESVDNYHNFRTASLAGLALNVSLVQSFIMVHILNLTVSDVVHGRITVMEGISLAISVAMVVYVLVEVAITRNGAIVSNLMWFFQGITLVFWFLIPCSVFRGNHPYLRERCKRRDHLNESEYHRQNTEEIYEPNI